MTKVLKKLNINQIVTLRVLVVSVFALMFAYLYFVNSTAFSAASYERISDNIIETQSEIGELELVFIEKNRAIEKEMSEEFALVKTAQSDLAFTKRNIATKLTFNE
jgi:hypothetical protein